MELHTRQFPLYIDDIKLKDICIESYQNYAKKVSIDPSALSCNGEFEDAFVVRNLRHGLNLILYNDKVFAPRKKHSLLHEVGHIKCEHTKHGSQEEVEANYFAAQMNAPDVLLREIIKRGYDVNSKLIRTEFLLSAQSAEKKIEHIHKTGLKYQNPYDDAIALQFKAYLNAKFPPINEHFYDAEYDEMEIERAKWML
jgi:Zn-dependent peptidase ImmA (M78 family)